MWFDSTRMYTHAQSSIAGLQEEMSYLSSVLFQSSYEITGIWCEGRQKNIGSYFVIPSKLSMGLWAQQQVACGHDPELQGLLQNKARRKTYQRHPRPGPGVYLYQERLYLWNLRSQTCILGQYTCLSSSLTVLLNLALRTQHLPGWLSFSLYGDQV